MITFIFLALLATVFVYFSPAAIAATHYRRGRALVIWGLSLLIGSFLLAIIWPSFVYAYIQAHDGAQPPWICVMEKITLERWVDVGLVAIILLIIPGGAFLAKGKGYSGVLILFVVSLCIHFFARATGCSDILGVFLGVLFFFLIVLVLPDREKEKE